MVAGMPRQSVALEQSDSQEFGCALTKWSSHIGWAHKSFGKQYDAIGSVMDSEENSMAVYSQVKNHLQ